MIGPKGSAGIVVVVAFFCGLLVASAGTATVAMVAGLLVAGMTAKRWGVFTVAAGVTLGLAASGWTAPIGSVGDFDVRLIDAPAFVVIVGALLNGHQAQRSLRQPLLVLIGLVGASAVLTGSTAAQISWLRLAVTVALALAIPRLRIDTRAAVGFAQIGALVGLARALVTYDGGRAANYSGPNSLGLACGVLVLSGLFGPGSRPRRTAVVLAGLGGLGLSRSIGSMVATAAACALCAVLSGRTSGRVVVMGIGALVTVVAISVLRPADVPRAPGFGTSSTAIRLSVAYAGYQVFREHPVAGVGWQQSSSPSVIANDRVLDAVRARFPGLRTYADADSTRVTSVHSLYVQWLAEFGLVGVAVLGWCLLRGRRVLGGLPRTAEVHLCLGLLALVAVWWNDNPLFGGQPETVLFFGVLGLLLTTRRVESPSSGVPQMSRLHRQSGTLR